MGEGGATAVAQPVGAVLVVGGGVSGVQSSLDLADSGFRVYLVEKSPSIGGCMAQLDKTFPTNDCSICILSPKLVEAGRHPNIKLITNAELRGVEGEAGNFTASIAKKARFVDEDKCTGCGMCAEKCPVRVPSEFDMGLGKRRAIYIPFPQAVPRLYSIDKDSCIYFRTGKCKICSKICPADAIDYDQEPEEILRLKVGSIVVSPGFDEFDPTIKREYGFGRYPNVISGVQFERILSASGPTKGHLERPSDGKAPHSIAFIQCVGSRDERVGVDYCSSVCCMFAIKEAIIAKEHKPEVGITVFYSDLRTFGKEFDNYYQRAKDEIKIAFTRSRVAEVFEEPNTNNLFVRFEDETGEVKEQEFDMVVLSAGLRPPAEADRLSEILGIELNTYGFCKTDSLSPMETTRPGVFAGGCFTSPKDIPDSVAQASGIAAKVEGILSPSRGTLVTEKEYVEEINVSDQEPRIGVFVCRCGGNVGSVVDVPSVVQYTKTLSKVAFAEENLYTCSYDSLQRIKQTIEKEHLNRLVVAACSPRTHEPLFQSTIREAGLNPYLFEMANIRDQCSWVHMKEPEMATDKAKDLVRMAVAKAALNRSLPTERLQVTHSAAVIGGGLSGMTAALELAGQGFDVHVVEREDDLGGNLRKLHYLATDKDPQEHLQFLIESISRQERISIHKGSVVTNVDGYVGNFTVNVEGKGKRESFKVGAIIVATGGQELKPDEYLYGKNENVLTLLEFEQSLHRGDVRADRVVVIQCVGSRTADRPYCSRVCCSSAVRNVLEYRKRNPEAEIYILYRDIRTYGFYEALYKEASQKGILFIRYDEDNKPDVRDDNGLVVTVKDPVLNELLEIKPDLLVLAAAIVPPKDNDVMAKILKVPLSRDGFFLEAHMKLRPVDFATDGVFLCGLAHWPKPVDESIVQACAAAARAATVLSRESIESLGTVAIVDTEMCCGCGICESLCPYGAVRLKKTGQGFTSEIIAVGCKGCGLCGASCPQRAITLCHYTDEQLAAEGIASLVDGRVPA